MQLYLAKEIEAWMGDTKNTLSSFKKTKICVVGIVGKSPLGNVWAKTDPINDIFDRQIFSNAWTKSTENKTQIEAYFEPHSEVLFLHLASMHDLNIAALSFLQSEGAQQDFYHNLAEIEREFVRSLLFLFLMSHVILFVEPCGRFDITYCRLLRSLNTLREDSRRQVEDILGDISGVSNGWRLNGRLCAPRLLFALHRTPIRPDLGNVKKKELLEKLQNSIEDQIYYIFRKSRIITNDSSRSIGAVPSKERFVFAFGPGESVKDPLGDLMDILHAAPLPSPSPSESPSGSGDGATVRRKFETTTRVKRKSSRSKDRFWDFLMTHVDMAHERGFNDNEGRNADDAFFELPRLETWITVAKNLYQAFVRNGESNPDLRSMTSMFSPELEFSEIRCKKVYPMALRRYQEGYQDSQCYPRRTHDAKLNEAVEVLKSLARGPCVEESVRKLREECDEYWRDGREACHHLSLTGNHCVNPIHKLASASKEEMMGVEGELPTLKHTSKARYLSTCNCGQSQQLRDDPFTLIEANYQFYNGIEFTCCARLEKYPFPLFKASKTSVVLDELAPSVMEGTQLEITSDDAAGARIESKPTAKPFDQIEPMAATQSQDELKSDQGSSGGDFLLEKDNRLMRKVADEEANSASAQSVDKHEEFESEMNTQEDGIVTGGEESRGGTTDSPQLLSDILKEEEGDQHYLEGEKGFSMSELDNDGPRDMETQQLMDELSLAPEDINTTPSTETLALDEKPAESDKLLKELEGLEEAYLSFMTHSQAPLGSLPVFPSWSVLCLGSSSIYTHAIGLRDRPNFSHGSHFLLPWKASLKVDLAKWEEGLDVLAAERAALAGRERERERERDVGKHPPKGEGMVRVKVFVGFEYECPRGHRFMLQSSDKMLKYQGPGGPKEMTAEKLVCSEMPVWFPCSCRSTPPMTGQLMRIHVVTPKAPVLITLNPQVQPDHRYPLVFYPGGLGRIQLTSAKYYVMRLPYSYMGPKGPFYPPKEPVQIGKILKNSLIVIPEWDG